MTPADRLAAYRELRPVEEDHTITFTRAANGGVAVGVDSELVLGNGDAVTHADDLLPVVAPDSAAARAAERSATSRHRKWYSYLLATASIVGGTAIAFDGARTDPRTYTEHNEPEIALGVSVMVVGAAIGIAGGLIFGHEEDRARRAAFATYGDGLRQQLALCVQGLDVIPCEQVAAAPGAR